MLMPLLELKRERPDHDESREWLEHRSAGRMEPGSVLYAAHCTAFQSQGGGEVQLVRTGQYLERRGWRIRPFSPWTDSIAQAKLVHIFGMSPEALGLARHARARGVPVVLSPICWLEPRAYFAGSASRLRAVLGAGAWAARQVCPALPGWRRALLGSCDRILPNSQAEAGQLIRTFGADPNRIRVVPNGVDNRLADPGPFREAYPDLPHDFVLFAGRIEPRKNLLRLIEAARRAGLPLVVLGDPPAGSEAYAAACRNLGGDQVFWLGRLPHNDTRLHSAMAAARVFALPSWFETPGLAALEAAMAGTPVVITPLGCPREYLGHDAEYAHPARTADIARALLRAWNKGPQAGLARRVRSRYLWAHVAVQTEGVYRELER